MNVESHLVFRLRDLQLGLDVSCVREIFPLPELIPAPEAPGDIIGLLNLRGKVLPIMHLDRRLGKPVGRVTLGDCVIVIEWQGLQVGMVVHQVEEVFTLDPAFIETDVSYGREQAINTAFLKGVAKVESGLILLLNPEKLIRLADEVAVMMWQAEFGGLGNALDDQPAITQPEQSQEELDFFSSDFFEPNLLDPYESPVPEPLPQLPSGTDFYALYCPDASKSEREVFQRRAAELRQSLEDDQAQNLTALAVIGLEGEYFGVSLETVREFITVQKVSPIPCCPEHIVGNMNLRGEVMTLIDIRTALSLPQTQKRPVAKAVITQIGDIVAGITVDEVRDILFLHPSDLTSLPIATKGSSKASFLQGMAQYGETMLSVLNLPKLLSAEQLMVQEQV
jgi:purine-binding chemotaxis protein CheW